MQIASSGDRVAVHYTGTLEDGSVFDTSSGRDPLRFVIGQGSVIPGFEAMILGMTVGEKKSTTIPPDQAYGDRRGDLVFQIERAQIPPEETVEVGQVLGLRSPDNREFSVTVAAISEDTVTLDGNHPLAGKALTFEIELVEVEPGSEEKPNTVH